MLKMSTFEPIMATIAKTELFRARIDKGRKARAERILKRYGLTPGEAVNVFFAKVEQTGGLPFDLRPDDQITPPKAYVGRLWDSLDS